MQWSVGKGSFGLWRSLDEREREAVGDRDSIELYPPAFLTRKRATFMFKECAIEILCSKRTRKWSCSWTYLREQLFVYLRFFGHFCQVSRFLSNLSIFAAPAHCGGLAKAVQKLFQEPKMFHLTKKGLWRWSFVFLVILPDFQENSIFLILSFTALLQLQCKCCNFKFNSNDKFRLQFNLRKTFHLVVY